MSNHAAGAESAVAIKPKRVWLMLTAVGCVLVSVALIVVGLVLLDKEHFGWLVGSVFLPILSSGVLVGSVVLLIGAWNLPERNSWRGITLIVWGLVALTSPALGLLFLASWGLLALSLPLVVTILMGMFRRTAS
ncbi:MAG: hypothetical protein ABI779_07665 [Acidobacteriota bacterium]